MRYAAGIKLFILGERLRERFDIIAVAREDMARLREDTGQPVTLSVHSDVAEEIHVHTDPEHEFEIKPGKQQRFTFASDKPGKIAVEVHHLDAVIAEVLVKK